jgi:hypothetical protein
MAGATAMVTARSYGLVSRVECGELVQLAKNPTKTPATTQSLDRQQVLATIIPDPPGFHASCSSAHNGLTLG